MSVLSSESCLFLCASCSFCSSCSLSAFCCSVKSSIAFCFASISASIAVFSANLDDISASRATISFSFSVIFSCLLNLSLISDSFFSFFSANSAFDFFISASMFSMSAFVINPIVFNVLLV